MKKLVYYTLVVIIIINIINITNNNEIIPNESIRMRVIPNSNNTEDIYIKNKVKEYLEKDVLNMISKTKLHEIDILKVKKYYEDAVDKRIIVLNEPLFYKDYLPYTEAMFVVYPSNRGGFAAQGVTKDSYTNELKKEF